MTDPKEMRLLREKMNEEKKEELKKQDIRLNKLCFDYHEREKRIEELEQENAELKKKLKEKLKTIADMDLCFVAKFDALEKEMEELRSGCGMCYRKDNEQLTKAKEQIEKIKYTLKKIIETVQNDRIDEYGARLVLIKDFAYECLQEIEK